MQSSQPIVLSAQGDLTASFIQHGAPDHHEAWANPVAKFDTVSGITQTFSQAAAKTTERFKEIVQKMISRSGSKNAGVLGKFTLRGKNTWAEVMNEANSALESYHKRSKRNPFIRSGQALADKTPALKAWIEILPSQGDYSSVACGALKLLFGAVSAMSKMRKHAEALIEALTDTVENTSGLLSLYRDPSLTQKAEELYIAVLEGTEMAICWLDSDAFKEIWKAVMKQSSYTARLEDQIDEIKNKAATFAAKINFLMQVRIYGMDQKMPTKQEIQQLHEDGKRAIEAFAAHITATLLRWKADWFDIMRKIPVLQELTTHAISILKNATVAPLPLLYTGPVGTHSQLPIPADSFLSALSVDPSRLHRDLSWAANNGAPTIDQEQLRAIQVLQDRRFQSWFANDYSEILVMNDMKRTASETSRAGPLSYFTARIFETLISNRMAFPLIFFCGLHASENDSLEGCLGLLKALNYQLLQHLSNETLPFLDFHLLDALYANNVEGQWVFFQQMVQNIRPVPIFCFIDDVSAFDNGRHWQETCATISSFRDLIESLNESHDSMAGPRSKPVLKLLMNFPRLGATSRSLFKEEDILNVTDSSWGMIEGIEDAEMQAIILG
ncbi:MAG: hypothetical protein Q9165_008115 [Trypethelium subeluteriae]